MSTVPHVAWNECTAMRATEIDPTSGIEYVILDDLKLPALPLIKGEPPAETARRLQALMTKLGWLTE